MGQFAADSGEAFLTHLDKGELYSFPGGGALDGQPILTNQ